MSSIRFDTNQLLEGLADLSVRHRAAVALYAETAAKKLEAYAKSNYKWTDRSYLAGKALLGDYEINGDNIRIKIEHGVEYGIYLEYAHGGQYAILWPTLHANSDKIMSGMRNLLERR